MNKGLRSLAAGFTGRHKNISHIIRIALPNLRPNPFQPRRDFTSPRAQAALEDLQASITKHGVQTPIHVQKDPDTEEDSRYIIIAGERRYRAAQAAGLEHIEAHVVSGDPEELALIENIQREDLTPIEEAQTYQRLLEKNDWNQGQLAESLGKKRNTINELLQINNIDSGLLEEIWSAYTAGQSGITKSVLIEIGKAKTPEDQRTLWKSKCNGGTSSVIKATRTGRKSPQTPVEKAVHAFTTAHKRLATIDGPLDPATYAQLKEIRSQINKLLKDKAPSDLKPDETP